MKTDPSHSNKISPNTLKQEKPLFAEKWIIKSETNKGLHREKVA